MDLAAYMSKGIAKLMATAYKNVLSNPREARFAYSCKIVFFVEYVPTDAGTEHLAFTEAHVEEMERLLEERRAAYEDIIFFSFPGDEKEAGGCLASGRGFFHIGPDGSAEPCAFSPFSDSNVAEMGLRKALQSPLFQKLRNANALNWEHTGGCTLWEHRDEVEQMMATPTP